MPNKSTWQTLMDSLPDVRNMLPGAQPHAVTQQLEQLPQPPRTFMEDVELKGQLLDAQRRYVMQELQRPQGIQNALGPMGLSRSVGEMMLPAGAVESGRMLGEAAPDMFTNPKQLGMAAMSLPALALMAATTKRSAINPQVLNQQLERFAPFMDVAERYATKVVKDDKLGIDPVFSHEKLAASLVGVADEDLPQAIQRYIKSDLIDAARREKGRGSVTRTTESMDANAGVKQLANKETITYQSPYDLLTVDRSSWNKFDLGDSVEALNFKKDLMSELGKLTKHPSKVLQSMNKDVASEFMKDAVAAYNRDMAKVNPKFEPIKVNLKFRDKSEQLLNQYFNEGFEPGKLHQRMTHRAGDMPDFKVAAKDPARLAKLKAEIAANEIPYKSSVIKNSAVKKMLTNRQSEMTRDELMGFLDELAQRTATKAIEWTKSRRAAKDSKGKVRE